MKDFIPIDHISEQNQKIPTPQEYIEQSTKVINNILQYGRKIEYIEECKKIRDNLHAQYLETEQDEETTMKIIEALESLNITIDN